MTKCRGIGQKWFLFSKERKKYRFNSNGHRIYGEDIAKSFANAEWNNLAKKMPEVLKSSMSKNTFKSYTVGLLK